MKRTFGNVIWYFPFFGFINAIVVWIVAAVFAATVVGLPIAKGLFEFGKFLLLPFGHDMMKEKDLRKMQGKSEEETNKLWQSWSRIISVLYVMFIGIWMYIIACCQIFGLFITIFGIPIAMVMVKSLSTYLNPVGKICVPSAVMAEFEKRKDAAAMAKYNIK